MLNGWLSVAFLERLCGVRHVLQRLSSFQSADLLGQLMGLLFKILLLFANLVELFLFSLFILVELFGRLPQLGLFLGELLRQFRDVSGFNLLVLIRVHFLVELLLFLAILVRQFLLRFVFIQFLLQFLQSLGGFTLSFSVVLQQPLQFIVLLLLQSFGEFRLLLILLDETFEFLLSVRRLAQCVQCILLLVLGILTEPQLFEFVPVLGE